MAKECVLYDRVCTECKECDMCDLNSEKQCDNCGSCIDGADEFRSLSLKKYIEDQRKNKN